MESPPARKGRRIQHVRNLPRRFASDHQIILLLPAISETLDTANFTGNRSDQEGQVRHRLVVVQQHYPLAANAKPLRTVL